MAEKKKTEDPQAPEKVSGSRMKWVILILILVLVVGGIAGAAYFFLVHKAEDPEQAASEGEDAELAAPAAQTRPTGPLIYHELEPLTVNITTPGPVRFLRLQMTVVTRDEAVGEAVDKHMPRIRNDLLSVLSTQEFAVMNTPEGKDALRQQLQELMSGILTRVGEPAHISDILFTDFVMQ